MKLLLRQFLLRLYAQQQLLSALEFGAVERLLLAFDFAKQILFDAVGQILRHLALCPAQNKWPHARCQTPAGKWVALRIVETGKLRPAAEHARHGKGHETP